MKLPEPLQQVGRTHVRWKGRKLSYFGGCDYFRLASHPAVLKALRDGLKRYGLNVSASRLTTGNHALYGKLEDCLRRFFGAQTATLASSGYAPNLMIGQALAGQYSHALIDERAHPSLVDAAQLLDCPVLKFRHRDSIDLARQLRRLGKVKPILLSDGMFSHDGGIAPLREYLELLPNHGVVLVDDAHGAGILGATGRGTPEHAGVPRGQIIQTITLSKAFGVYGGAVLASQAVRDAILARSRVFVGNTPLPLPLANAAITAINLLRSDRTFLRRLERNASDFKERLRASGFPVPDNPSPILPVVANDDRDDSLLKRRLIAAGIHPPLIKYPGRPEIGYFRFVVSSEHTPGQIASLVDVLRKWKAG
jgi:8-amino-7-oxononanoate synthase